jgi:hypothetical protein
MDITLCPAGNHGLQAAVHRAGAGGAPKLAARLPSRPSHVQESPVVRLLLVLFIDLDGLTDIPRRGNWQPWNGVVVK